MQQGQQEFQQGKHSSAIKLFSLATKIAPLRAEGWVNLGVTQAESGLNKEGQAALQRAINLNSNIMPAHMALGDIQRVLGHLDAAFDSYQRAVSIQRTPLSLNKLAAIQRTRGNPKKSAVLYREALHLAPDFTLARVNLATVQVDLQHFDEAKTQLDALAGLPLSPMESKEVNATLASLDIYNRLQPPIKIALSEGDLAPMERALQAPSSGIQQVDEGILKEIRSYANFAMRLSPPKENETQALPDDWPLIEALFMIPFVESAGEFLKIKEKLASGIKPTGDLLESVNMTRVVSTIRNIQFKDLLNPIKAEMHLRHWHALATIGIENMVPGQFKMVQNMSRSDVLKRRAEPHLVTGTFRQFISEIYVKLPPGLLRGLVVMMAIFDIHPFPDGNGRIAMAWLNRELELVGQTPVLFTKKMGIKGKLSAATREVRSNAGDLSPFIAVVAEAQQFSRDFCAQLTLLRDQA